MPEESRRDTNERAIRELLLAPLDDSQGRVIHDNFVEACTDKAAGDVLKLLASLDEQVIARRDLDGNSIAGIAAPDVESGIARATVNGQEVEVGMEPSEDRVLLAEFHQIRGGRSEEVGSTEGST
jgi:hypothetical protein